MVSSETNVVKKSTENISQNTSKSYSSGENKQAIPYRLIPSELR
jgi:hypothetical protein